MADPLSGSTATERTERLRPMMGPLIIVIAVALFVWGLDQATKQWALSSLTPGQPEPVIGEALQWLLVRNSGAAFSIASGATWIFTVVAFAVLGVLLWLAPRIRSRVWVLVFGLVLGGTIGNLTDRLFREPGFGVGHVIDFIWTPWMMPAIYNVADCAIVVGMCAFVVLTLFDVHLDGTRGEKASSTEVDSVRSEHDSNTHDAHGGAGS